MELITKPQMEQLKENGRKPGEDYPPVVKIFTPDAGATWLLQSVDPEDQDLARERLVMGVRQIDRFLGQWEMDARDLHRRMILAPTPREREHWHAVWLLAQGWTASATAEALERDPHTIGRWAAAFGEGGPAALIFEQSGGFPPPALGEEQQATLKGAVQELSAAAGIGMANWNWRVVHQFVSERFGISLSRSSCLNYLHRLGFVRKRPKKRLVKANEAKRESFVAEYAALTEEAPRSGAKIFFADEAHFRADAELRGKWVLKGEPALVESTSPRRGEKASYYSAVCLETGEVEWMELDGNSNAGTSAALLMQLKERCLGPLNVIWDNTPAHRGEAVREYLRTPGMALRLVNLPGYSPDFNGDEAIWGWAREEATGNLCLGTKAQVQERVGGFLAGLVGRQEEVKRRCRTILQSRAQALLRDSSPDSQHPANVHPTLALV